jgi:hypothetical protein
MSLKCIFAREALLAVLAREGLDGKMDSLVALQVVISVEGLGTLITFKGTVVLLLMLRVLTVHWCAHLMALIWHVHAVNKSHLSSWAVDI